MKKTLPFTGADRVIRTVDLVVAGGGRAALAAAADALQSGQRVIVVLRAGNARVRRHVRRCLCTTMGADDSQVRVMTNAEVVCVDGVERVEAVVIRYVRTGRLCAVNASAFLSCDGPTTLANLAGRGALNLRRGDDAIAVVKSTEVMIARSAERKAPGWRVGHGPSVRRR